MLRWLLLLTAWTFGNDVKTLLPSAKEASSCSNDTILLDCDENYLRIVIQDATLLYTEPCNNVTTNRTTDLRHIFNRRCSGRAYCSLRLSTDEVNFENEFGVVRVLYDCVSEFLFKNKCDRYLKYRSGYVATPGYPDFYPPMNCRWSLKGEIGQVMHVLVLDLQTKVESIPESGVSRCVDYLKITEGLTLLDSFCDVLPKGSVPHVQSIQHSLNLTFTSKELSPRRGVLFFYKAIGCPPLTPPHFGYLVFSNASHSEYLCCVRHVFPDTLSRQRMLFCEDQNHWNDTLPDCVAAKQLYRIANKTAKTILIPYWNYSLVPDDKLHVGHSNIFYDFVLPVATILFLMIGNSILVAAILTMRKRKEENDWKKKKMEESDHSNGV